MRVFLKSLVEHVPYSVGRQLARVPFSWRLGPQYHRYTKLLDQGPVSDEYIVEHFSKIFEHAKKNLPFYRDFYTRHGVMDLRIESLEQISQVPILRKADIRKHLDQFSGAIRISTGGTSGEPLSFYVDSKAHAREWAHMHRMWGSKGYDYRKPKLTFRGLNLGSRQFVFNAVHNEFRFNTFIPVEAYLEELLDIVQKQSIEFIYGYPSSIQIFLKELEASATPEQIKIFTDNVRCCLLASEYPLPNIGRYIRDTWGLEYVSWYGHSEMCVLAHDENSDNHYVPFHSYGYAEVHDGWLLGTSYHNYDMPLIRYDTHDHVLPSYSDSGVLESFSIQGGRAGDVVIDRQGKELSVTGLVFARKHEIFNFADSVQVRNPRPGRVDFLVTTDSAITADEALLLFDLENIDMDFTVELLPRPILTDAGKMPLKVYEHVTDTPGAAVSE